MHACMNVCMHVVDMVDRSSSNVVGRMSVCMYDRQGGRVFGCVSSKVGLI